MNTVLKKNMSFLILAFIIIASVFIIYKKKLNLGLDLRGGTYVVLQADLKGENIPPDAMDRVSDIIDKRVNAIGIAEPNIQRSGENNLIVELAGIKDTKAALDLIGTTAKLEFKIKNADGTYGPTLLTGDKFQSITKGTDSDGIKPVVNFILNDEGAQTFAKVTRENEGKQLAIILDGIEQSAPVINSEIPNGQGQISTGSMEEADKLEKLLKAGSLPVDIKVQEVRTVGATLGVDSIKQTQTAGLIALVLICTFMFVIYKFLGIVADIALIIYGLLVVASLSLLGATLTLPGIAGIILSLGMAVDANVIIFERIKEEIQKGSSVKKAIEKGTHKSFSAIFDGNIVVMLISGVLFMFGTGGVRGFAVTLTIGTIITLFIATFVTGVLLKLYVKILNPKREDVFWKGVIE